MTQARQDEQRGQGAAITITAMPLIDPVKMSGAGAPSSNPSKPSLPIELLPTDLARIFTHVHPVALLSAFYLRFPALVAEPVPTLLNSLLPLAVIQIAYAVICLPAAGSSSKPVKKGKLNAAKKTPEVHTAKAFVNLRFMHHIKS